MKSWWIRGIGIFALGAALSACGGGAGNEVDAHGEEAGEEAAAAEYERGPNNGRMLREGDFALELAIFEDGVPPQYRVWATNGGQPVDPRQVNVQVTLRRLGGQVDQFSFTPEGAFLVGSGTVEEPHSFDVEVTAEYGGWRYRWAYPSYEGRTQMSAGAAEESGVRIEQAGPATIGETRELLGTVVLAPSASGEVRAQFPGPIRALYKQVGQSVRRGELIARVESNESLQTYPVYAPMAGVIAERNNVGDIAGEEPLYRIVNPSATMVQFNLFSRDLESIQPGQQVTIQTLGGTTIANVRLGNILPQADASTGTAVIQAPLPNPGGRWRAGMSLKGQVLINGRQVALAVRTRAIQRFRDFTVVFSHYDGTYEVRMLELGQRTPEWTEILGGLNPGTPYVTDGAFLIRADVEKSGASHDH